MNAITFHGVSDVRAETVADPKIVDATDVIVKITTSAVCGSDLHQYHGRGGGALVQRGRDCRENGQDRSERGPGVGIPYAELK